MSSSQIQSIREYRQPLQRISDSKINSNNNNNNNNNNPVGSIYSGPIRILKKEKSPSSKSPQVKNHQHNNHQHQHQQQQQQRNETHYMQSTESSRLNINSTPKRMSTSSASSSTPLSSTQNTIYSTPSRSISPSRLTVLSTPKVREEILSTPLSNKSKTLNHQRSKSPSSCNRPKEDNNNNNVNMNLINSTSSPSNILVKNTQLKDYQNTPTKTNKIISHSTSQKVKSNSNKSSSRSKDDVFSRLTQGLPTRHTAPPSYGKTKPKRSQSTSKIYSKNKNLNDFPTDEDVSILLSSSSPVKSPKNNFRSRSPLLSSHNNNNLITKNINKDNQFERSKSPLRTQSPNKVNEYYHYHQSHSLLRNSNSNSIPSSGSVDSNVLNNKISQPKTLASQLLLPSPPRDFISGIPEPPISNISSINNQNVEKSFNIQNLRDMINSGNLTLPQDLSADSELTLSGLPDDSRMQINNDSNFDQNYQEKKLKNEIDGNLFQTEVSIVEESESRCSSPRSLLSGSAWTIASESFRPSYPDIHMFESKSKLITNNNQNNFIDISPLNSPENFLERNKFQSEYNNKMMNQLNNNQNNQNNNVGMINISRQPSIESIGDILTSSYDISGEILNTYDSFINQSGEQNQMFNIKKNYLFNLTNNLLSLSTSRSNQLIDSQSVCLTPVSTQSTENELNKSFYFMQNKDNSIPKLIQQFPPSLPNFEIEAISSEPLIVNEEINQHNLDNNNTHTNSNNHNNSNNRNDNNSDDNNNYNTKLNSWDSEGLKELYQFNPPPPPPLL